MIFNEMNTSKNALQNDLTGKLVTAWVGITTKESVKYITAVKLPYGDLS